MNIHEGKVYIQESSYMHVPTSRVENSVDLHCIQNRIHVYRGLALQSKTIFVTDNWQCTVKKLQD